VTHETIIYTHTDEAPALATYSLLPVIQAFAATAGVVVETRDISLAGRILAAFPEHLDASQRVEDALGELGALVQQPEANVIKLPNISASIPQLKAAIAELRAHGYTVPDYPESPTTDAERDVRARYDRIKGSAVNPVLRQGNSDRRAPASVKQYARTHPHQMGAWSPGSKTNVAHMDADDFRSTERSAVMDEAGTLRIELVQADGTTTALRDPLPVLAGEVVDAAVMRVAPLAAFGRAQIARAKAEDVLFSIHLKATMMKVSDPIIFGHVVRSFLPRTFERYGAVLDAAGLDPDDGLAAILHGLDALEEGAAIRASIDEELAAGPPLAMVDSDRGITNLHVPSDVIVDASMPAMIRTSGHMWGPDGQEADTLAVIPDSSYAGVYQAVIDDCRANGAYDPSTMGSVPNVGLMAQAAEEYGSHDKTFEIPADGTVRVLDDRGTTVLEQPVGSHHGLGLGDVLPARRELVQMTRGRPAPAQVGGHIVAHHEVAAAQLQEGVLGRMHAHPGASQFPYLAGLTVVIGVHVGDEHGRDRGERDLALAHPGRQCLPAVGVIPAGIDHDEASVVLDQVGQDVAERVADDRHRHRPYAAGDLLDRRELGSPPCLTLPRAGYLHRCSDSLRARPVRDRLTWDPAPCFAQSRARKYN